MASLPYLSSPGNIDKALNGIKSAAVPDRVSQDFVKTILKIPGGSGDQMTAFFKKLGLTNVDGTPTDMYRRFRNPASSGVAIAAAIKTGYAPLYLRNEFMHELNETELLGLIVEETGQAHDSQAARLTASCIKHLKAFANFAAGSEVPQAIVKRDDQNSSEPMAIRSKTKVDGTLGLNLGYTINLNLPATSDPKVFDAIFKNLKDHLLRDDDA